MARHAHYIPKSTCSTIGYILGQIIGSLLMLIIAVVLFLFFVFILLGIWQLLHS